MFKSDVLNTTSRLLYVQFMWDYFYILYIQHVMSFKAWIFSHFLVLHFQDEKKSDSSDPIYKRRRKFCYLEEVCC